MAIRTKTQFKALYGSSGTMFPDNTTAEISEGDMRSFGEDIADSFNDVSASGITREFNRAFDAELLFDKNEIYYDEHELTGDVEFTVASSGNLSGESSSVIQIIKTDGTHTITFGPGIVPLGNTLSGSVPDEGTYYVFFHHWQGITIANWAFPSIEVATLTPLSPPANFADVPGAGDPETEVDLTWDAVPNVSSYEIYYSTTGGSGPWISLTNPAAGATSYTHTGLTPATTYHYRIRAIGDLVVFSNSVYSTDATTTEDSGDITAPTFTFSPVDAATDIPMNGVMVITASAPLRDQDGVTVITDANLDDYITAVNSSAAAQPFTATIDATKTIITVTPNVVWTELDDITITIDGVESSVNGVHAVSDSATFTTNDYTRMNANYLNLGTQFDSVIVGADKNFEFEYVFKDAVFVGLRGLFQKNAIGQECFLFTTDDDDVYVDFYGNTTSYRRVRWTNALAGVTDGEIKLKYFGAIDTNNGLDRLELYIDDVLITAGKAVGAVGALAWPFDIKASTAPLYISGPTFREVKDAFIRSNMGATVEGSYPVIRTGEDQSGNNRDGTWL